MTTCAWILLSTAPAPKRTAIASAVARQARSSPPGSRASISLRSGVPRQYRRRCEASRWRGAARRDRPRARRGGEATPLDVRDDRGEIVIAVRSARHEARRIVAERASASAAVTVSANSLSSIRSQTLKRKTPPGAQHAPRLGERLRLVGKEHDAELADDGVERVVRERQPHRVGLAPLDRPRGADRRGMVEHRLVQVGGDDRRAAPAAPPPGGA